MYWRAKIFIGIVLLITGINCYSQTIDPPYEIGTWHGFRQTVINYTFDDGCPNQFAKVIPMFNAFDFDLTLFTVTDWTTDWARLQSASDSGHEVASHTVSHANFGQIDEAQERTELRDSKEIIESHITGENCITMAYPYCVTGVDSICSNYYIAARGCQNFIEPGTPGSFMNVSSIVCGSEGSVKTLAHFKSKFESAAAMNGWCVFLLHGIDGDGGYSSLSSSVLISSIEYLNIRRSKFWVTTFKNAALYSLERNAATITEISSVDTAMTIQVSDTLVDSIFNFPLTIRRPLPLDWPSADVTQNDDLVPTRIVQVDTVIYITFDVIPDGGDVMIIKNDTYVLPDIDTVPPDIDSTATSLNNLPFDNGQLEVLISDNNLILKLPIVSDSEFMVNLYDLKGVCLLSRNVFVGNDGRTSISLSKGRIPGGIYVIGVSDGISTWSKKIAYNNLSRK
jgi:peptidoglycan-N-acetylglucosamine deacetylase